MPKVMATADLHGLLPEIPDCDLLVIAGDICPDFISARYANKVITDNGEQRQRHWLDTDFRSWLESLHVRGIDVVAVAGNHDYVFEHTFLIPDDLPWTYLRDEGIEKHGLRIWGTPWVPNLPRWAFYGTERALEIRTTIIPEDLDILISHGPPRGFGDYVVSGGHVGDEPLRKALKTLKPKTLVCGHIHEGHGTYDYSDVVIYNVAFVDEFYDPINKIVELVEFTYANS